MGKKATTELQTRLQAINDEMEFYMELFNIPEAKKGTHRPGIFFFANMHFNESN